MRVIQSGLRGVRLVRGIISGAVLISGAFGVNAYMNQENELSVSDVIQVVDSKAFNHGGLLHASGSLKNISDIDDVKVTLTVDFLDKDENVIKSVEETNNDLDSGEIWNFDVASLAGSAEYYSISNIEIEYR